MMQAAAKIEMFAPQQRFEFFYPDTCFLHIADAAIGQSL
jgi:hypothetical protein